MWIQGSTGAVGANLFPLPRPLTACSKRCSVQVANARHLAGNEAGADPVSPSMAEDPNPRLVKSMWRMPSIFTSVRSD